jgi:hypothetical protein
MASVVLRQGIPRPPVVGHGRAGCVVHIDGGAAGFEPATLSGLEPDAFDRSATPLGALGAAGPVPVGAFVVVKGHAVESIEQRGPGGHFRSAWISAWSPWTWASHSAAARTIRPALSARSVGGCTFRLAGGGASTDGHMPTSQPCLTTRATESQPARRAHRNRRSCHAALVLRPSVRSYAARISGYGRTGRVAAVRQHLPIRSHRATAPPSAA